MQSSTARAIAHFAFGILAALVLIAVIVPASIMAGIAAFAFGYLLGISNFAIGLVGVATAVPFSIAAILWIWPDLKALAIETTLSGAPRKS